MSDQPVAQRDRPHAASAAALPWWRRIEGLPIIIVFLVLVGLFMVLSPEVFLGWPIYLSFLTTVPPMLVLALGLTLIIAAGEIDLSFPSVVAFSGFLFAWFTKTYDQPWIGAIAALIGGALVGWLNGVLVAYIGIPSIIATIGTQFFWAGIATVLSGGLSYSLRTVDGTAIYAIFAGELFGHIPMQALWAVALAVAIWFVLNRHRFGEHLLFIGDSQHVARVVGINVAREKMRVFILMGIIGGFSAVLLTLENKNFFSTQGSGYLLNSLASVFIGGTSVFGGAASVVGSFFGAFIIGMIEAGIVATGIEGFWVRAIVGVVFVAAVVFHLMMDDPKRLKALHRRLFKTD
ncbi:MAG TPA: ABC transporter permease [Dongiaceae bacterium]|jgi:simple sugar transport system permease protein